MTVTTNEGVGGALKATADAMGLAVDHSFDQSTTIAGPFVTAEVRGTNTELVVAVRDDMGDDTDAALETLASSVVAELGGDNLTPSAPAADSSQLLDRFDSPTVTVALTDGGQVQALVVTRADRRGSVGQSDTGPRSSSPASHDFDGPVGGFEKLANVGLDVSVELGRTQATLAEVLAYDVGSVVELDRAAGSPVDVRVNGTLLAQGEVVLIDDEYAVRITAIVDPGSPL